MNWRTNNEALTQKGDAIGETKTKIRNNSLMIDIVNEKRKKDLNNSQISYVKEFIKINRETILTYSDVKLTTKTKNKHLAGVGI